MKNIRTNILIVGTSRSGSHALVDLFSEYDNIRVHPGEFDVFRAPGMVADQLDEEMKKEWPSLISKYLYLPKRKNKILKQLLSIPLLQKPPFNKIVNNIEPVRRRVVNYEKRKKLLALDHLLQSSASQEEKLNATKDWIQDIGELHCNGDSRYNYFLFDQPLTIFTNIEVVKKVFEPFRMVCSLRDPKDQMANVIRDKYLFRPYGAPKMNWGFNMLESQHGRTRQAAFKLFTEDIKVRYELIQSLEDKIEPENIKIINFESLVKNYEKVVAELEEFVGLHPEHHTQKRKYFDPDVSKKNIGYHAQFLKQEEYPMLKDLERMYYERFPENSIK